MKKIKQIRNELFSAQVDKCKDQLNRIGITYDNKSAHVEVPNLATGGVQYFKWDWLTSTTDSNSGAVSAFKQILNILEARNNPAQYNSLVSNLNASTKNALEATIKKHNMQVPNSTPYDPTIAEIKTLADKHWVKYDEEGIKIGHLNPENPKTISTKVNYNDKAKLAHVFSAFKAYEAFENNNITEFEININSNVAILYLVRSTIYFGDKYVGTGQNDREKELAAFISDTKLNIPKIYNHVPVEDILYEQASVLKDAVIKASKTEENNVVQESKASDASNVQTPTSDDDSDDDIEVISKILGSEVTLTNGAKYEVKKIIDLLDKPNFIKQLTNILSKLSSEDSKLITKEVALKLAYISNNDIDKYDAVHEIVDNMPQTFIDEFNSYDILTLDQMRTEEAKILGGGASYLE